MNLYKIVINRNEYSILIVDMIFEFYEFYIELI